MIDGESKGEGKNGLLRGDEDGRGGLTEIPALLGTVPPLFTLLFMLLLKLLLEGGGVGLSNGSNVLKNT